MAMNQKNFDLNTLLRVALVVFVVASVGGFLYGKYMPSSSSYQTQEASNTVDTSTWITLDQSVYTIKHPADFIKTDVKGNITLSKDQFVVNFLTLSEIYGPNDQQAVANRMAGGSLKDVPYTIVSVDGVQAVRVENEEGVQYGIVTGAKPDGFVWISAKPAGSPHMKTFEAMINTLQLKSSQE